MQAHNTVTVTGLLHHIRTDKKSDKYFPFSIKQETPWNDGTTRRDFLLSRAFQTAIQEEVKNFPEGTPLRVRGTLQSSLGSGEMYIHAEEVQKIQ
ncbi:MAG: OB-fold nucleic acid binding domain-containing protein [Synergistaceae bacterium]|jgi:hypothetical protein|nr:OB-fold nucleic acid binding domain-containing protein [Synergistaceae bacterium]